MTTPSPNAAVMPSDTTIIKLNTEIDAAIRAYLPTEPPIDIVFDIPEPEKTPEAPTVSVFLFDVQVDLELRASQQRVYDKAAGRLDSGFVNVACRYLITYWGTSTKGQEARSPPNRTDISPTRPATSTTCRWAPWHQVPARAR